MLSGWIPNAHGARGFENWIDLSSCVMKLLSPSGIARVFVVSDIDKTYLFNLGYLRTSFKKVVLAKTSFTKKIKMPSSNASKALKVKSGC